MLNQIPRPVQVTLYKFFFLYVLGIFFFVDFIVSVVFICHCLSS